MKTREQKIYQAMKLYFQLNRRQNTEINSIRESFLLEYIMININNPDFFISNECNIKKMTLGEIYKRSMENNIIYL